MNDNDKTVAFKYNGLEGLKKSFELNKSAHAPSVDWVEDFGVAVCWYELREFKHKIIAATAKESDLSYFKSQLDPQFDAFLALDKGKCRCDTCGQIFDDDDPGEIEFMRSAREKFGPNITREQLIIVCEECAVESEKERDHKPGEFRWHSWYYFYK
ncbi:hypothetical protein KKI24_09045 [bacterium]|nr:hypothetical protein [bacterium]